MIIARQFLLGLCFTCLLPHMAYAEAPVVDDSENFAIIDEQQAALEQPVAKAQFDEPELGNDEEIPLARDTIDNGEGSNAALLDKLQGMRQEIQELRGQLEVQSHDLKLLQQQQLAFYKDLDARINKSGSAPVTAQTNTNPSTQLAVGPAPVTPTITKPSDNKAVTNTVINYSNPNPADEQISYLAAYELVKNKRYDDALVAMQTFITQYPQGGYTANAQYWLGELYMVKKNYSQAIEHFETVLQKFHSSSKAAASALKIGYALAASGKEKEARQRLLEVLKNYPDTPTAQLASAKLQSLKTL